MVIPFFNWKHGAGGPHCDDTPIPLERMIYIGDGLTDVPALRLMAEKGGQSCLVFDSDDEAGRAQAQKLFKAGEACQCCPADYRPGTLLEVTIRRYI